MKLPRFLFWFFQLSAADQLAVVGPYSIIPGRHRALIVKRSHNMVYTVVAVLAMFLILPLMPFHWLAIPTAIGGGLSFALILSWFWQPLPDDDFDWSDYFAKQPRSSQPTLRRSRRFVVVVDRTGAARIMRREG